MCVYFFLLSWASSFFLFFVLWCGALKKAAVGFVVLVAIGTCAVPFSSGGSRGGSS